MIDVKYNRDELWVTVKGHAESGAYGYDTVCAAASALAYTLSGNVAELEKQGKLKSMTADLAPGDAVVRCAPYARARNAATIIFDTVCYGLEMLAEAYPENVRFTKVGDGQ